MAQVPTTIGIGRRAATGTASRETMAWLGPGVVALAGLAAYVIFPDDLGLLARVVSTALFVLSLDLVVGYCGVATLGHAALFGAGAYAAGIFCVRFVNEPLLLIGIGAIAGALAGLVSGAVILRASGLPQLVLSIAVVQLFREAANKMSWLTGGSDGLSGIRPAPLLGAFAFDFRGNTAYLLGLALLLIVLVVLNRVVRSPFGLLCRGIREDQLRVEAMGARVFPTLLKMYVLSGAVAGIAGAHSAITAKVVSLDSVSFERSAEALVMLVLGGAGTLYAGLVATPVFIVVEHRISELYPFHWLFIMGALLVAVVLFLPRGLQQVVRTTRGLFTKDANGDAS